MPSRGGHFPGMPDPAAPPEVAESLSEYHRLVQGCWHVDPFTGYDLATKGLAFFPDDLLLQQRQAHALARTGSTLRAKGLLEAMVARGHRDPETLGLLGRVWKDLSTRAPDEATRRATLRDARDCYGRGLASAEEAGDSHGYYPGINAAALSVVLGEREAAMDFARRTEACAGAVPKRDYWVTVTLAEVALIRGDLPQARARYAEAVAGFSASPDQLASTRRQARLVAGQIFGDESVCDDCFPLAPVTVFVGHLTDAPGRARARFPESMAPAIEERLRARLKSLGTRIGYASGARGGDLIFLKCLQELGAETQVVLALEKEAFRGTSVHTDGAPRWNEEYDRVLAQATAVRVANRHSSHGDSLAYEYAALQVIGLARLRARQLGVELRALVLWDGEPGDAAGGTAWTVQRLLEQGIPVENIHPAHEGPVAPSTFASNLVPARDDERAIRCFLFSDCKGYSKLREEEILDYTRQFFAGVARLIARSKAPPIFANTWGDGLYLVFREIRDAGDFARDLRDAAALRAAELGLPKDICLRIALHAGPASPVFDPITNRQNFVGVNVALAARIEPITLENQIFTSEPFAALCAEAGADDFAFEYLGTTEFAKHYGALPLYHLRTSP